MQKAVVTLLLLLSSLTALTQSAIATNYGRQARMLFEQESYHDAELYADSAALAFRREGNLDSLRSTHWLLYEIQRAKRDEGRALVNLRIAMELGDSIEAIRYRRATEALTDSIGNQKETNRIDRIKLTAEMERRRDADHRAFRNTLLIAGSLLSLALIVLLVSYRRMKQQGAKLGEVRRELQQLQEFREKLFTVLSTDLKNLLISFENLSKGLAGQVESIDKQEIVQLLSHLRDTAAELKNAVGNVVEWVGLQANARPFQPASFDCKLLIESVVKKLEWRFNAKNLHVETFIPENQIVFADKEMVEIVLESLLSNSIQFIPAGRAITCFSGKKDGLVTIGVKDTGPGMRPEDVEKLFMPGEDIHSVGQPGHKGGGVGLLLAKDLVERNGGRIYVESIVGEGSTFYFSLPESDR